MQAKKASVDVRSIAAPGSTSPSSTTPSRPLNQQEEAAKAAQQQPKSHNCFETKPTSSEGDSDTNHCYCRNEQQSRPPKHR